MDCLIALFSVDYIFFKNWRPNEPLPTESDYLEEQEAWGKAWGKETAEVKNGEIAFFQNSFSAVRDYLPASFRRFVLVGNSLEEQLRNVFELGFEKGYQKVLFVESSLKNVSTEKINWILNEWEGSDMIFWPSENGAVSIWGLNEKSFWKWNEFRFYEPEILVELISEAMEKDISYQIIGQ
jgi:hypothetical protein